MAVHSFVYEALRGQVADGAGTYPKVVRMQTLPASNRPVGLLAGLVAASGVLLDDLAGRIFGTHEKASHPRQQCAAA